MRASRKLVVVVLIGVAVASGVGGGTQLVVHAQRTAKLRKRIARLEALAGSLVFAEGEIDPRAALLDFDEPEAVLALIRDLERQCERYPVRIDTDTVRRAVELFAIEPAPDPRPRAALEALSHSERRIVRFWAFYLLSELDHPRQAREPDGFAPARARIKAPWRSLLDEVRRVSSLKVDLEPSTVDDFDDMVDDFHDLKRGSLSLIEDAPWRALLRFAQKRRGRVVVTEGRIRINRELYFDATITRLRVFSLRQLRASWSQSSDHNGIGRSDPLVAVPPAVFVARLDELFREQEQVAELSDIDLMNALAGVCGLTAKNVGDRWEFVATDRFAHIEAIRRVVLEKDEARRDIGRDALADALLDFDEPEALIALVEDLERLPQALQAERVIVASELAAATPPVDPRIVARLEKIAHKGATPLERFVACYALEELRTPRFPPPPEGVTSKECVRVPEGDAWPAAVELGKQMGLEVTCEGLDQGTREIVGSPWRALVRLARWTNRRLIVDGRRVTLAWREPDRFQDAWESPDFVKLPESLRASVRAKPLPQVPDYGKGLRALAAMNGERLREADDGSLVVTPVAAGE